MKKVYGYIRVSTAEQGKGASPEEQKDAILRYAENRQLQVFRPPKQSDEVTHKKM